MNRTRPLLPWTLAGALAWTLYRPAGSWLARAAAAGWRRLVDRGIDRFFERLVTEPFEQNLWELVAPGWRVGAPRIMEMELRARTGDLLNRPFGPPHRASPWHLLVLNPAQPPRRATPREVAVDTRVRIGPRARRPLELDIPILLGGMAYGLALSLRTKVALARAATLAGTATNTGEGPYLPEERAAARRLVVQYHRGRWGKSDTILRRADMVEIQFGQGAYAAVAHAEPADRLDPALRRRLGLAPGEDAVLEAFHPGLETPADLARLVERLRRLTGGVPVGAKIAATQDLEANLHFLVEGGVDAIAIDGAEAGTRTSPPILQGSCGIPTLYAVARARAALDRMGAGRGVSLLAGGGLYTPADFLKALALGADACYIGTIALFALVNLQVTRAVPWEPPTQLILHRGSLARQLRIEPAARSLANFLRAAAAEMAAGVQALGKTAVTQVGPEDLVALDARLAQDLGLAYAALPSAGVAPESRSATGRGRTPAPARGDGIMQVRSRPSGRGRPAPPPGPWQ